MKEIRWTGQLQRLLGDSYEVVEEGCNGRTTMYGGVDEWSNAMLYLRPCLYSHRTIDYLVMMLGTNDLKKKYQASPQQIGEGVEALIKETVSFLGEQQGCVPQIILIAPPVLGDDMANSRFSDEFDEESVAKSYHLAAEYQSIAQRYGCTFLNASEFATVSKEDSLHLEEDSHTAFAKALYECMVNLAAADK